MLVSLLKRCGLLLLLVWPLAAQQIDYNTQIKNGPVLHGTGAPAGSCTAGNLYTDDSTGTAYGCDGGTWVAITGSSSVTSPVTSPSPFQFNTDLTLKGPNPYIDIRAYGARACAPASTPCAVGLTANTTGSSTSVTISSASSFVNGDGVVIYGAGTAHAMSTPTAPSIDPILAMAGTGTGIVTTTVATGATTYNYIIVAQDKNGGLTAASPAGSTTTGQAALGSVAINITSMARSGSKVTVTLAAPHPLSLTCNSTNCGEVYIPPANLTNSSFAGWHVVTGASDNTHFTFYGVLDTRGGAATASTGGTAAFFIGNHLTLPVVTGAWKYYICSDRANPGTYALIGQSRPEGALNTDYTFDDFGSPFMDGQLYPPWVTDAICNAATPTSDHLSTTIASGAGTTSLVLTNAAGTSVTGATIRLDAGPGIAAAAAAINASGTHAGTLVIPATAGTTAFVVNSFTDISADTIAISQLGRVTLNETISEKGAWYGDRNPQWGNQGGSGVWQASPIISVGTANPGIYNAQRFATTLQGVSLSSSGSNGALLALYEGGFNMAFIGDSFVTSTGNADYLGIGLYLRGASGQSATNIVIDRDLFSTGGPSISGATHTPVLFCDLCGQAFVRSAYYLHRGVIVNSVPAGGMWDLQASYINGGFTPQYTFTGGANSWSVNLHNITDDTFGNPTVAAFSGGTIFATSPITIGSPTSQVPPITGSRVPIQGVSSLKGGILPSAGSVGLSTQLGGALDGTLGTSGQPPWMVFGGGTALGVNPSYPIFVNGVAPAAPTCSVGAGGSVAAGTYQFALVPIWASGGEGAYSIASTACTTTAGNQTITVSWPNPAAAGNPEGYNLYWCTSDGTACTGGYTSSTTWSNPQAYNSTGLVWSSGGSGGGASNGALPTAGPTMLMPGTKGVAAPAMVFNPTAFLNLGTPVNGTVIYCYDCGVANPCAGSGTGALAKRLNGAWVCN